MVRLKVIFFFLFYLYFVLEGYSQNFKARFQAGLNVAQVDGDSYGGYNQPGILAGISILRTDNIKYNYGFELNYSMKGSHKKTTEIDPDPFQLRHTYICLPIFVDLKNLGPHLKNVRLRLAISNNLKIASKVNFGFGWAESDLKPWELSGIVGVGYQINKKIGFMIRHENSILSVGKPGTNPDFYKVNRTALRNRLVSFVFQYEL